MKGEILYLSEATLREPTAILIQEALKKIGVEVTLEKVPGSNWFAQMASKKMPMVIPLYTRFADVAMQQNVQGYEYWFHTHPDFRKIYKN